MNGGASGKINPLLAQFMGLQPNKPAAMHDGRIWHFSDEEKKHLRLATAAFTLALGFMWVGGLPSLLEPDMDLLIWMLRLLVAMPVMLLAVGPAFLLHEIGHKIIAKRNGCWAEFRADPGGLRFGILLAFFLGFLFMAPGAVMVAGVVTRRQNGHIAVAGPLVNFGLFIIGIPMWGIILGLSGAYDGGFISDTGTYLVGGSLVWQQMLIDAGVFWLSANLVLGLFNMIPWGPLDGAKVKDWNDNAFYAVISIFLLLVVSWVLYRVWSPARLLNYIALLF
jgi:Zn-dependent protease